MDEVDEDEDEDDEFEEFWEILDREGQVAYSRQWVSRDLRDRGEVEQVLRYQNQYYYYDMNDDGPFGPFHSLERAVIASGLYEVHESIAEIEASELDVEGLQSLLVYTGQFSHTLLVNGQKWHTRPGGKLAPEEQDE